MSEMLKIYLYSSFGYYVRKGDIEEKDFRGFFQKRENDLFSYSSEIAEKIKFSNFSNCIRLRKVAGKMRVIEFSPPTTFFRQLILRDTPCPTVRENQCAPAPTQCSVEVICNAAAPTAVQ